MNLVEERDFLKKELENVLQEKQKVLEQLKNLDITIERYTGAIIQMNKLIQDSEKESSDKPTIKPKMVIEKGDK